MFEKFNNVNIEVKLPNKGSQSLVSVMDGVHKASTFTPYSEEVLDFCATFAQKLSKQARGIPELQALAFWMRKAELHRLKGEFEKLVSGNTLLVPRGTVFHVPPANVDTIFVYSWLLSVLAGNKNIIRMSSRQSNQSDIIINVLNELLSLDEFADFRDNTVMVRYGHEQDITTALSSLADVRVIWGGDKTIEAVRQSPLLPHSIELTFPDRFSLAAINADEYVQDDSNERHSLAEKFFNDSFWFDQLGCSSPRLVIWVGEEKNVQKSSSIFYQELQKVIKRKEYKVDIATAINKLTFSYRTALEHEVKGYDALSNELTILPLEKFSEIRGDFCGAGLFFQIHCTSLRDIVPYIERRDQTLSYYGFSKSNLLRFLQDLNGKGIDRIVPFGEALTFNRYWDGFDLLQSFTRRVNYQY